MKRLMKSLVKWFVSEFYQLLSIKSWHDLRKKEKIMLELGSGIKRGENGWTTVDIAGADIKHDLRKGIPLPDGSVDRIYTSHMLEHIPYKELVLFINECYRVLKVNGELSVCVPDAKRFISAYMNRQKYMPEDMGYFPAIVDTGSYIDQVNYLAYMDGHHRYLFDEENLVNTLKKAPFRDVRIRIFDSSLDLLARDYQSIYASATK
jgi:predicted SAM-dependent methyltransferase